VGKKPEANRSTERKCGGYKPRICREGLREFTKFPNEEAQNLIKDLVKM